MSALARSSTAIAAATLAVAALTTAPPPNAAPALQSHDIRLTAAATPPGGLITSFLGNQLLYCSLICTSAVQGALTVTAVALQTPATFVTAAQSGDLVKAIGITAASVTAAAEAAAADVIFKDGQEVAPRALNAFETGVVGLLNIAPAVKDGLPGVVAAINTARDDTFTALNLPIVPNPTPTVMPRGVVQVAVIGAINIGAAVIFPAFNDVLLGAFQVPDAVARTLAQTGDPVRAIEAGVATTATVAHDAGSVVAQAVDTAVANVRAAADHPAAKKKHASSPEVQKTVRSIAAKKATDRPHRQHSSTAKHSEH